MQTSDFSEIFFRGTQDDMDIVEFALDRQKNKTGDIWHVSVEVVFVNSGTILPLEMSTYSFLWTCCGLTFLKQELQYFFWYKIDYGYIIFKFMFHLIKVTCICEGLYLM